MSEQLLPVAIVGGGPVGLASSIMLSLLNIPHLVFEQFPSTSIHPKAVGLNQRSVELFTRLGIEDQFNKHRAPSSIVARTGWFTGIGPSDRAILVRDAWAGGQYAEAFKTYSPAEYSVLPQIRLEPILQKRALELNPKGIRYTSMVKKVTEKPDRVTLTIQTKDGTVQEVDARYVLGADGGRGMAEDLGIGWNGERDVLDMITVHFKADIHKFYSAPGVHIWWLVNPKMHGSRGTGFLYHLGPYDKMNASGNLDDIGNEFSLAAPKISEDPAQFDEQTTIARVRKSLGIPDLKVEVKSISHWMVNARVTERYRSDGGRVFLVGDAGHRVPPWGALGLNSGLQDVQNLIWKLALAINSGSPEKYEALLNSYEIERKPIAERVAKNSLSNMRIHAATIDKALGITAETSTEENVAAVEAYFDEKHSEYKTKRANVIEAERVTDQEFHAPGIEIGWFYPSVDVEGQGRESRHGGQIKEDGTFDFTEYHPSTIPGHNMPHSWLKRGENRISTRDLARNDRFVLITGDPKWKQFGNQLLDIEVLGNGEDLATVDGQWPEDWQIERSGALLLRPDGIVAWRVRTWDDSLKTKFDGIFGRVLGRS